jgi:hypothetical protein
MEFFIIILFQILSCIVALRNDPAPHSLLTTSLTFSILRIRIKHLCGSIFKDSKNIFNWKVLNLRTFFCLAQAQLRSGLLQMIRGVAPSTCVQLLKRQSSSASPKKFLRTLTAQFAPSPRYSCGCTNEWELKSNNAVCQGSKRYVIHVRNHARQKSADLAP